MSFDQVRSGCVIRYPYLWSREAARGETEGREIRPVAVALRIARPAGDVLLLRPITSKDPGAEEDAMEIPAHEKRRGGLDEFNQDIAGRSFDLLPGPPLGSFGKTFFDKVLKAFLAERADVRGIDRLS